MQTKNKYPNVYNNTGSIRPVRLKKPTKIKESSYTVSFGALNNPVQKT